MMAHGTAPQVSRTGPSGRTSRIARTLGLSMLSIAVLAVAVDGGDQRRVLAVGDVRRLGIENTVLRLGSEIVAEQRRGFPRRCGAGDVRKL